MLGLGKGGIPASNMAMFGNDSLNFRVSTLPETNIAPKNGCLEYYFPIGEAYFQGLC